MHLHLPAVTVGRTSGQRLPRVRLALHRVRLQLTDDWRRSWRWACMRFSAASVVMNVYGAIALKGAAAASTVLGLIPMRWALVIGALVSLAAIVGRLVNKEPADGQ